MLAPVSYLMMKCLFSCTALFVSISQVIGCEDRLRNDLYCVGWGVKLYSLTHSPCLSIMTLIICHHSFCSVYTSALWVTFFVNGRLFSSEDVC